MGSFQSLRFSIVILLFFSFSLAIASGIHSQSVLRVVTGDASSGLSSGASDEHIGGGSASAEGGAFCDGWRLSVETNNAGSWKRIPSICLGFVAEYMNGERYASDSDRVFGDSLDFAKTVQMAGDGKDIWIFDVDETLLSNLPYYAQNGYGSKTFNETSFDEWVNLAIAPPLGASLRLYEELLALGFQMVLLTGRNELQRKVTEENLLFAGYHSWQRLILREASDTGKPAVMYKSEKRAELEAQGFRIQGNSGDQWSDLLGSPMAIRSFKLQNPMYYIV